MTKTTNQDAWLAARNVLAAGVNSPVRAFKAVGGDPVFYRGGQGAFLEDLEGRRIIDYVSAWGGIILGHADPDVAVAVAEAARHPLSYGAPTEAETRLAERLVAAMPWIERVRLVNSGTEATMAALRLARGFTKRTKIVKFAGCYHGHADGLLVRAGSGAETFGVPDSAGVPPAIAAETLVARYNDLANLDEVTAPARLDIAAVILEPVVGNMGVVPPAPGFLEGLRVFCDRIGALLVFDEVMTGFRVAPGGAAGLYGIRPDLVCLGKIIGGGLPIGAYGGRRDIMDLLAPNGPVYQAGTNSGNPVAMAAGQATLERLTPTLYKELERRAATMAEGLLRLAGPRARIQRVGSMMTLFFFREGVSDAPITNADDLDRVDRERYAAFFRRALARGVAFPPSACEAFFLTVAHTEEVIAETLERLRD
jgi:glutamate-1-semialdehyde 2,1-aminomutase